MDKEISDIFHYQYNYNPIYRNYVNLLGIERYGMEEVEQIPFLPISFFKTQKIITSADPAVEVEKVFTSSSTTGQTPSKHFVIDLSLYEKSFLEGFKYFYGEPSNYCFLALLPSYLERGGSSLVYMAEKLIQESKESFSGFFLYDYKTLFENIVNLLNGRKKVILLGVTYALLDYADKYPLKSSFGDVSDNLIIMETGGMKGKREEMSRDQVHSILKESFGLKSIHSEYGMCELLSQAYSKGDGLFRCPPSMKILIRDISDPLKVFADSERPLRGAINIIDKSNLNSCSFIQTDDMGTLFPDGSFTVEGRIINSERRGCNMLIE